MFPRFALLVIAAALLIATCGGDEAAGGETGFIDVAAEVGLDFQHSAFHWDVSADPVAMMGGGLCWIDYDRDGWLDLFLTNTWSDGEWGTWNELAEIPRSALYRNVDGKFEDVSLASGAGTAMRGNGCVTADFDLDGYPDLYVTSDRFNALFWNNGDGTFDEGAQAAGVMAGGWQSSASVGDLNGDGWPDLFVAGYADLNNRREGATTGFPNTFLPVRNLLYLSEGASNGNRVVFREVGVDLGVDMHDPEAMYEYGLGGTIADFDQDGDLDLFVANDTNPNRLYENVPWPGGAGADPLGMGFRLDYVPDAGVEDDNSGMGVAAADYSGDGLLDLFITNLGSQLHSVYVNQTDTGVAFRDGTVDLSIPDVGGDYTGWGVAWVDLDLDTDLDLVVANGAIPVLDLAADAQPLQALANQSAQGQPLQLVDVTTEYGLADLGPRLGRGMAWADYDNDGDIDLAVGAIGSPVTLLENQGSGAGWLTVAIDGFAPGTQLTAVLPNGTELTRFILAGSSYLSSEDPRAHFGLGDADRIEELRVRWPGGRETVLTGLDGNQIVELAPPG